MDFKKGNLLFLYFLDSIKKKINFKQFSILNALLLKKVLSKKISKHIKIKWPNDLLFNKEKFCEFYKRLLILINLII